MEIAVWRTRLEARTFRVDLAVGIVVAALALFPPVEVSSSGPATAILAFSAIALRRVNPTTSLVLAWLMAVVQITLNERPNFAAIALVLVVYAAARIGNRWEMIASGISAGLGGILGTLYLGNTGARYVQLAYGSPEQKVVAALAPVGILACAWLVGLTVKFFRSQQTEVVLRVQAEDEATKALDTAEAERLRATMARDVHDIVGHSLAVIIAQADSVEFLDDESRIRQVSATIAQTARRSLAEVRQVLSGTTPDRAADEPEDLDTIVEQIRAAGVIVDRVVRGEPRATDVEHAVVVRRVAQEMLTNALRHGAPGHPIDFRESWRSADVVLEVDNVVGHATSTGTGLGIDGMQTRVAAVGGTLEAEAVDGLFSARARIPLPPETAAPTGALSTTGPVGPLAPVPPAVDEHRREAS